MSIAVQTERQLVRRMPRFLRRTGRPKFRQQGRDCYLRIPAGSHRHARSWRLAQPRIGLIGKHFREHFEMVDGLIDQRQWVDEHMLPAYV